MESWGQVANNVINKASPVRWLQHRNMVRVDETYFYVTKKSQKGPFCIKCWDDERKQISLISHRDNSNLVVCPKCNRNFQYRNALVQALEKVWQPTPPLKGKK